MRDTLKSMDILKACPHSTNFTLLPACKKENKNLIFLSLAYFKHNANT